jgi:ribulose-phosphate 3-epimerase
MKNFWNETKIYAPSLITLDMCNLESQIRDLEESGIEVLHVDILDGYFSPSMPLGFETVKQLRSKTNLFFDCHVMANDYDFFVDELIAIGVQQIVFQLETAKHIDGLLNKIHNAGIKAGVALKPSTPLSSLDYILDKCDTVVLMLINPGYASSGKEGQIHYADRKIKDLRALIDSRGLKTKISIDGRISPKNIADYGNGLVDIFVLGTTCLSRNDLKGSLKELG